MSEVSAVNKENIFLSIWKGLRSEWMKIIFPSNEQVIKDSVTVLVCSLVLGVLIFILDSIIGAGFGFLFVR